MRYGIDSWDNSPDSEIRDKLKDCIDDGVITFEHTDNFTIVHTHPTKRFYAEDAKYLKDNGFKYNGIEYRRERFVHPDTDKTTSIEVLKVKFKSSIFTRSALKQQIDAEGRVNIDEAIADLKSIIESFENDIEILNAYTEK